MNDLLIDPFLLSIPEFPSPSDAERFVERAVSWPNTARELGFRIVASEHYISSLVGDDNYPTLTALQKLCTIGGIKIYDAHTLHRSLDGILNRSPKIERILTTIQVLLTEDGQAVEPEEVGVRLSQRLGEALHDALAICGLHAQLTGESYPFGLLTELPSDPSHEVLDGTFSVIEALFSEDQSVNMPATVLISCRLIGGEEELFKFANFPAVAINPRLAIEWSWRRAFSPSERSIHRLSPFAVRLEYDTT